MESIFTCSQGAFINRAVEVEHIGNYSLSLDWSATSVERLAAQSAAGGETRGGNRCCRLGGGLFVGVISYGAISAALGRRVDAVTGLVAERGGKTRHLPPAAAPQV